MTALKDFAGIILLAAFLVGVDLLLFGPKGPALLYKLAKKPAKLRRDIVLVVSGTMTGFEPAKQRPGCVLTLTNGTDEGRYYVPLDPHHCRQAFPEGEKASLRIEASVIEKGGVIDTVGDGERFWDIS